MNSYEEMLYVWDKLQDKDFLKMCIVDKPKKIYDEKTRTMISIDIDIYHRGAFGKHGKLLSKFAIHLDPFGRWYVIYQPMDEKVNGFLGELLFALRNEGKVYTQSNQKEMTK